MKQMYQKPQIHVEELTLDTTVTASSCQGTADYAKALTNLNVFDDKCTYNYEDPTLYSEDFCYNTAASPSGVSGGSYGGSYEGPSTLFWS